MDGSDCTITVSVSLDAFDMAVGGGWSVYSRSGALLAMCAYPGLPGRLTADEAARKLLEEARTRAGSQSRLF